MIAAVTNTFQSQFRSKRRWCGLVYSVAVMVTALNLLPPTEVVYEVRSEAVFSENCLSGLDEIENQSGVELVRWELLDETQASQLDAQQGGKLALVAIESSWTSSFSTEKHQQWLQSPCASVTERAEGIAESRAQRFAKWELQAAEHYAKRHDFLNEKAPLSSTSDGITFELARSTQPPNVEASLAAYSNGRDLRIEETEQQTRTRLQERVRSLEQRQHDAFGNVKNVVEANALVSLASAPMIETHVGFISNLMVFSILMLGICTAFVSTWLFGRLQSGNSFSPLEIARELASDGIPISGAIEVQGPVVSDGEIRGGLSTKLVQLCQAFGRRLILLGEIVVFSWALILVARLVFDPVWRGVFFDSPLAGLARLLLGMP